MEGVLTSIALQNGLLTWDRKEKIPSASVKEVMERVKKVYYEGLRRHW